MKLIAVAATKFICGTFSLDEKLWANMLDSIITVLSQSAELGYTTASVNLLNASREEDDMLEDIGDAKEFVVSSLAMISYASPGRYPQVIAQKSRGS